jgi:hypothetical protein
MKINWDAVKALFAVAAAAVDGKKTYLATNALIAINALVASHIIKPFFSNEIQGMAIINIGLGGLVLLFRALASKPGVFVKKVT